jgi:PAS domain-containing protein
VTEIVCLKQREAEQCHIAQTERLWAERFEAELFLHRRELAQEKQLSEERHRPASALRASEERLRLTADPVPQIVWVTDAEGRVEFFNLQWSNYTGVPYEPTTAADVAAEFVHPEDGPTTMEALQEARCTGTSLTPSTASGLPRVSTAGFWYVPNRIATPQRGRLSAGSAPLRIYMTASRARLLLKRVSLSTGHSLCYSDGRVPPYHELLKSG